LIVRHPNRTALTDELGGDRNAGVWRRSRRQRRRL